MACAFVRIVMAVNSAEKHAMFLNVYLGRSRGSFEEKELNL